MKELDEIRFVKLGNHLMGEEKRFIDEFRMNISRNTNYKREFGGGCFATTMQTVEGSSDYLSIEFLLNPKALYMGMYTGDAKSQFSGDSEIARRLVVSTPLPIGRYRGKDLFAPESGRYSLEWLGKLVPETGLYPTYQDDATRSGELSITKEGDFFILKKLKIFDSSFVPKRYKVNQLVNVAYFP